MAIAQQSGMHGISRGAPLLDPTTMWIRVLLAGIAAVIFMICSTSGRRR
jgi:hypothetical protein